MVRTLWDSITEFLSPEAGPRRTQALQEFGRDVEYYVPPELRGLLGFAAEMTPSETLSRAGQAGGEMLAPGRTPMERVGSAGRMLSETAGVVAPIAVAQRAGMTAAQALQEGLLGASVAGRGAADAARRFAADEAGNVGRGKGIRAYHGSPHDFDRFSMDKIGTGEGAQAYGHGLYFAENEGVAEGYRDILSGSMARNANSDRPSDIAFGAMRQFRGDRESAADWLAQNLQDVDLGSSVPRYEQAISILRSGDEIPPPGRMYEVRINADPDDFLDWDAPLSEQPRGVRDFANARWQQVMGREPDATIEGEYIAKMASPQHGIDGRDWLDSGPAADQAKRLREAGIPGIKYRDAGSRGMDGGTRNFVVFDENLIEIVRKYGIAGAAAMLGMSQADVAQAMQQQSGGLLATQPTEQEREEEIRQYLGGLL